MHLKAPAQPLLCFSYCIGCSCRHCPHLPLFPSAIGVEDLLHYRVELPRKD